MSKIADDVYKELKLLFPYETIEPEYYIWYKGSRLFFDYFLRGMNVLIEVQGRQHFEFVKHFHGDAEAFKAQKYRDNLKREYIEENPELTLVLFYDKKDKITKELVVQRIYEAQCE